MTLANWLEKTHTTQEDFSEKSGVPQPLVSRYARGKVPKAHYMLAIQKATDGAVSLEDWAKLTKRAA